MEFREDAENKAAREAEAMKKRFQDQKDEADRKTAQAEADKEAAETKAEESAAAERKKIADEAEHQKAAAKKREDDQAHNKKINNEALTGILIAAEGISKEDAKNIVIAIAQGEIPHVTISY